MPPLSRVSLIWKRLSTKLSDRCVKPRNRVSSFSPLSSPCGAIINSKLTWPNLSKATVKIRRNPAPGFNTLVPIFFSLGREWLFPPWPRHCTIHPVRKIPAVLLNQRGPSCWKQLQVWLCFFQIADIWSWNLASLKHE